MGALPNTEPTRRSRVLVAVTVAVGVLLAPAVVYSEWYVRRFHHEIDVLVRRRSERTHVTRPRLSALDPRETAHVYARGFRAGGVPSNQTLTELRALLVATVIDQDGLAHTVARAGELLGKACEGAEVIRQAIAGPGVDWGLAIDESTLQSARLAPAIRPTTLAYCLLVDGHRKLLLSQPREAMADYVAAVTFGGDLVRGDSMLAMEGLFAQQLAFQAMALAVSEGTMPVSVLEETQTRMKELERGVTLREALEYEALQIGRLLLFESDIRSRHRMAFSALSLPHALTIAHDRVVVEDLLRLSESDPIAPPMGGEAMQSRAANAWNPAVAIAVPTLLRLTSAPSHAFRYHRLAAAAIELEWEYLNSGRYPASLPLDVGGVFSYERGHTGTSYTVHTADGTAVLKARRSKGVNRRRGR